MRKSKICVGKHRISTRVQGLSGRCKPNHQLQLATQQTQLTSIHRPSLNPAHSRKRECNAFLHAALALTALSSPSLTFAHLGSPWLTLAPPLGKRCPGFPGSSRRYTARAMSRRQPARSLQRIQPRRHTEPATGTRCQALFFTGARQKRQSSPPSNKKKQRLCCLISTSLQKTAQCSWPDGISIRPLAVQSSCVDKRSTRRTIDSVHFNLCACVTIACGRNLEASLVTPKNGKSGRLAGVLNGSDSSMSLPSLAPLSFSRWSNMPGHF